LAWARSGWQNEGGQGQLTLTERGDDRNTPMKPPPQRETGLVVGTLGWDRAGNFKLTNN